MRSLKHSRSTFAPGESGRALPGTCAEVQSLNVEPALPSGVIAGVANSWRTRRTSSKVAEPLSEPLRASPSYY